jgi:hypothetical protein
MIAATIGLAACSTNTHDVALDAAGNVYVIDGSHRLVVKLAAG